MISNKLWGFCVNEKLKRNNMQNHNSLDKAL